MQNQPDALKNRNQRSPKPDRPKEKKGGVPEFLIETNIAPLVFAGKCIRQFGWSAVIGFCLGATGVYGYAFAVKSLPLVTLTKEQSKEVAITTPTPVVIPKRRLHGVIKSNDKPVTEDIEIGVLSTRQGPFQSGKFSIEVPESDRYQITLWNQGYQRFKLVELRPDMDGNVHDVIFPSSVLALAGDKRNLSPDSANAGSDAPVESTPAQVSERSTRTAASRSRNSLAMR